MSNRAEEAALKAYPEETRFVRDYNQLAKRQIYQQGYKQAEKDLIEKAWDWMTSQHGSRTFDDFKKAMEEE